MSFPRSVGSPVKSIIEGSQAISEGAHHTAAQFKSLFSKNDTLFIQVKQKLMKLQDYKGCADNEIAEAVESLVTEEGVMNKFSHLTALEEIIQDGTREEKLGLRYSCELEREAAKEREQIRFDRAAQMKLTICLRSIRDGGRLSAQVVTFAKFFDMDYGSKHAAILVDDVLLEWNTGNLVFPRTVTEDDSFDFEGEVQKKSGRFFNDMVLTRPKLDEEPKPFQEEGVILYETMEKKKAILKKIVEVIIKYNGYYYYNTVTRNCQTFVNDIIEAVEIPKRRKFSEQDEEYVHLTKKGLVGIPHKSTFKSHEEINQYVSSLIEENQLGELNKEEVALLRSRYEEFHDEGLCTVPLCRYQTLLKIQPR